MVVGGRDADAVEAGDIGRRACLGERLALDGHKQFLSFGLPDIFRSGERWSWNPHDPPSWDLFRTVALTEPTARPAGRPARCSPARPSVRGGSRCRAWGTPSSGCIRPGRGRAP